MLLFFLSGVPYLRIQLQFLVVCDANYLSTCSVAMSEGHMLRVERSARMRLQHRCAHCVPRGRSSRLSLPNQSAISRVLDVHRTLNY